MGQKVHPIGFRVGITKGWQSTWFAGRNYADLLHDDLKIRKFVKERLSHAGVSNVEIERASNRARINIWTARPGIIIGKRGSEVDKLKAELVKLRFFVGMSVKEAADALGISLSAAERSWVFARAWLHSRLNESK